MAQRWGSQRPTDWDIALLAYYGARIVFPVVMGGMQVYDTNRSRAPDVVNKSKNPPNKPGYYTKSHCLLGFDNCIGVKQVAVVEGPFSMLAFPHAVCLMERS